MLPLADGGDGTLDVLNSALGGEIRRTWVRGPLGKPVLARWGHVKKKKLALIEMAEASGLRLIKKNRIRDGTSFGTGQLIRAALEAGCRSAMIGVGGTATADGGAGALQALGLRYLDRDGRELQASPADLIRLFQVDETALDARLKNLKISVLCDVTNPLLGPRGSARVFGPQKGASPADVRFLEKVLSRWSRFARRQTKNSPGAGAAGAVAFGLSAFLGASLVEGAPFILKTVGWKKIARQSKIILTGEGKLDRTSFSGKVVGAVLKNRGGARVGVVCGSCSLSRSEWKRKGIAAVEEMGKEGLMNPKRELKRAAYRLFRRFDD